ncbi:hypothetical protein ACLOJK_014860, partial [Asimina triloba]
GARAPGSVRPQPTSWSTFGAPSLQRDGRQPWLPPLPPAIHRCRRTLPSKTPSSSLSRPTIVGPSLPRSKPLITMATTSTFQIWRPQADVDHRGHTRQIFLTRHQQIHLHPASIVAHFKSEPYHHSIWIFRGYGTRFDPIIGEHKHDAKHFLLRPHLAVHLPQTHLSSFSVTNKPSIGRSRLTIMSTRSSQSRNCRDRTQRTPEIISPALPSCLQRPFIMSGSSYWPLIATTEAWIERSRPPIVLATTRPRRKSMLTTICTCIHRCLGCQHECHIARCRQLAAMPFPAPRSLATTSPRAPSHWQHASMST